ncbi:hypothetical protein TSAR_002448, partial [Trichomalopsis sarcophagae]
DEELDEKIKNLNDTCLSQNFEFQSSRSKKDRSLKLMTEILYKSSSAQLQAREPNNLIECAIKILLKYSNTPLHFEHEPVIPEKKRNSRYILAKKNYYKLLKVFFNKEQEEIVEKIIDVLHSEKLWQGRRVCIDIIIGLLDCGYKGSMICNKIFNKIEATDSSNEDCMKLIIKVLYEFLDSYKWPDNQETVLVLERLLHFYYKSSHDASQDSKNRVYANLRGGLELCVRHMIPNISNNHLLVIIQHMSSWSVSKRVSDNIILNYGSTLEYAAYMHQTQSFVNTLSADVLPLIMQMIGSHVKFVSLLGNRVLQHLIDRGGNQMLFNSPKIFFENMQLNLKLRKYNREDRKFLKQHREVIHDSLIKSVICHRGCRLNLETTYCTICLLAIEVPCGFTAAALCCIMMHLQEIIMKRPKKFGREASFHIHAIIISVLSFVCWIHEAKDFHTYVNKIVMERAQWAPHLNPPLQSRYKFAVHHVLWDKPELFLIDWEVRFGLWKRFRLNESSKHKTKRVYYED